MNKYIIIASADLSLGTETIAHLLPQLEVLATGAPLAVQLYMDRCKDVFRSERVEQPIRITRFRAINIRDLGPVPMARGHDRVIASAYPTMEPRVRQFPRMETCESQ